MRRRVAVAIVLALLLQAVNPALHAQVRAGGPLLARGVQFCKVAQYTDAIQTLQQALEVGLSPPESTEAYFYIGVAAFLTNDRTVAERAFRAMWASDPAYTPQTPDFPPDMVSLIGSLKPTVPVVTNVRADSAVFHPYQGEKPGIRFSTTLPDRVGYSVASGYQSVTSGTTDCPTGSGATVKWDWSDAYLRNAVFDISLRPEKNAAAGARTARLRLDVTLPAGLTHDSEFQLSGRSFRPESRTERRMSKGYLWTGVVLGLIVGAAASRDDPSSGRIVENKQQAFWTAFSLLAAGGALWSLASTHEVEVPDQEAIRDNGELKQEIEARKRQVVVRQAVQDDRK